MSEETDYLISPYNGQPRKPSSRDSRIDSLLTGIGQNERLERKVRNLVRTNNLTDLKELSQKILISICPPGTPIPEEFMTNDFLENLALSAIMRYYF